ncbi:MAG TPA: ATP-binding protein [Ktedonobacteraceae bacterium]|nr:ATP-binding protein [Ktedonobacteraceae bacterium]
MTEERIVQLTDQWITAAKFEQALQDAWKIRNLSIYKNTRVTFHFPSSCKIMVEASVRLLSLANHLVEEGSQVTFKFEGEQHEAMSYLNRANFFALLSEQVVVLPVRPNPIVTSYYQGHSPNLVEFKAIHPRHIESVNVVPSQLADKLAAAISTHSASQPFGQTPFTIFAELISNVYHHSQTELDGFAALQVYKQRVQVVVSDSGIGLLETLRPKLLSPSTKQLEDMELIRLFFRGDLAWDSGNKGQGLQECARRSLKLHGSVSIRLALCSMHLNPSPHGYETTNIHYQRHLVPLKGTHICFSFPLDNSK